VECWTVRGGGHTWPGGPRMVTLGRTTTRFDASVTSWEFVAGHFLPAADRRLDGSRSVS
jgi:poly(3-hydroxybutyrate) depolymerase